MRIAICFSGQLRTSVEASPNLLRYFGPLRDSIDIFFHTWDITQYKPYGCLPGTDYRTEHPPWRQFGQSGPLGDKPVFPVMESEFEKFRKIYCPCSMEIEDFKKYQSSSPIKNHRAQFYSLMKSVIMSHRHGIIHNTKYDVVIKMRPDVIYPPTRTLEMEIKNYLKDTEAFYIDNEESIFWIASPKNMLLVSTFGAENFDPLLDFRSYIKYLDLKIKPMVGFGYTPLRPEGLQYDVLAQFSDIFYADQFWYSSRMPFRWIDRA